MENGTRRWIGRSFFINRQAAKVAKEKKRKGIGTTKS
jgi:hypothetical protein